MRLSLSVHLCECLLAVWIPVFICHFGHGLAGLAGLAGGELGGAQLLEVSGRAQLLETVTFLLEI